VVSRLQHDEGGEAVIRPVTPYGLRYILARVADWYRLDHGEQRAALPPMYVVNDMLAEPEPPLPMLTRITRTPTFAVDGSLCNTPGYHAANRVYYAPTPGFQTPLVSECPSKAEVAHAVALIAGELLGDFPFTGPAEAAHAIALFLLPFVRDLIDGPTPLFLIEKPAPGTGGTLLADVLALVAYGVPPASLSEGRDEEEWRKRITAKLLSSPTMTLIDNVRRPLDSSALASAITSLYWEDRILGRSEMARVPVRCAWVATGNNPTLSAEMIRRTVPIRLDAKTDRPWLRTKFRHPDLLGWVRERRGDLVWAALTLAQAWITEGRPAGDKTLGMFDSWAKVTGGILGVAGMKGFLMNLEEMYELADTDSAAIRGFLATWWDRHLDADVTVAELFDLATAADVSLDIEAKSEQGRKVRLGLLLKSIHERRYEVDGKILRVVRGGTKRRATLWKIAPGESGESDESVPPQPRFGSESTSKNGPAGKTHETHAPIQSLEVTADPLAGSEPTEAATATKLDVSEGYEF
jgi:hypothetical protein